MASTSTPELKVILCGEYGVGKTSIFRRFTNNTFVDNKDKSSYESRQSTIGLDQSSRTWNFEPAVGLVKIKLFDTGGLERVASITTSYYKFAEAALLVFSLNSLDSFHSLPQHLLEILNFAEGAKIFLVANKVDLTPPEVTEDDIQLFLEQFPKFSGVFRVSCKSNQGIADMFDQIAEKLASNSLRRKQLDAFQLHSAASSSSNRQSARNADMTYNLDDDATSCCAK